jgi:hypothetical protein
MNKKLLLAGFVIAAGFIALTAFGGQTLEQQKADIAKSVAAKLDALRADKAKECDDRVNTEAKTRFDKAMAEKESASAKAPAKSMVKKGGKTPKAAPLPPATKPTSTVPTTDEAKAKSRMTGQAGQVDEAKAKARAAGQAGQIDEQKAKSRMSGGKKPATTGGGN